MALYIRHIGKALLDALHDEGMSLIHWLDASERQIMRKIMYGFENCIGFVDGTKQSCLRPSAMKVHRREKKQSEQRILPFATAVD